MIAPCDPHGTLVVVVAGGVRSFFGSAGWKEETLNIR